VFPLCGTALTLELTPSIFDSLQAKRQSRASGQKPASIASKKKQLVDYKIWLNQLLK
jgi:hypothetical protein